MFDFIKEISGILIPLFICFCIVGSVRLLFGGDNDSTTITRSTSSNGGEETIKIRCYTCSGKGYMETIYMEYETQHARSCTRCGGNGHTLNKQVKEKTYHRGQYANTVKEVKNSSCVLGRGFYYAVVPKGATEISKNQSEYLTTELFNGHTIPNQETVCKELLKTGYRLHSITDTRGETIYT